MPFPIHTRCERCGVPLVLATVEGRKTRILVEADDEGTPVPTRRKVGVGRVQLNKAEVPMFEGLGRITLEVYPIRPAGEVRPDVEVWQDHEAMCRG